MPQRGDPVEYVAIASGCVYPAVVQATRPDGSLDIEVSPSVQHPLKLTRVPFDENPAAGARGIARPARAAP